MEYIDGSPLAHGARVTDLEDSLKDAEKRFKVALYFAEEKTHQVEEHRKVFLQETKVHAKALKSLHDEVVDPKRALHESLRRTM